MKNYQYEQLDADTKAYLRFVRDGQGRGAPGVFLPFTSHKPTWALLAGLLVLGLFLWTGYTSTKAGWAVAMLQTAGVLLGGWLIAFAVRRWTASPDKYAGHFAYFDPEHAYLGMGEEIQVAKVGTDADVQPRGEKFIRFDTKHGAFNVPAPSRVLAQFVADFYGAVKRVRSDPAGGWAGLNAAETGGVARFLAEEGREPNTLADTGLEVDEIPNQVSAARERSLGLVRYLVLLGIGAGLFALFAFTNPSVLDDLAFAAAKDRVADEKKRNADPTEKPINKGFTGAFAVRDYLLDPKHVRHRKEAEELLSGLYAAPIDELGRNTKADPALRAEVVQLLEILRRAETPAVSFRVSLLTGEGELAKREEIPGDRGKQVRSLFADGFASALGKDLVVGTVAGEGKKANVEVAYRQDPRNPFDFLWTVEVRARYDQKTEAVAQGVVRLAQRPGGAAFDPQQKFVTDGESWTADEPLKNVLLEDDAVYKAVMTKLVGQAPARPMAD